jgi:deoxyribodipyrimidine photo-lyase
MTQLNTTGFMHNRGRMIVANYLTRKLNIDWRLGERYFASKLVDYDPCSNNGGWQWASGTGADAQPLFRIFNPELQAKKFDPRGDYRSMWLIKS